MSPLKRAKTTTTYSTKKPSASSIEREKFLSAFGDDAIAPNTSPSIRFSDHSGVRGSSGLPAGSLQAEFANHEPAMFKESGSTIPDNESSHERMVEQALRSKSLKATTSPGMKLVESDEMPKSSSFPWSASEQTEVTRSHVARDEQPAVPEAYAEGSTTVPQPGAQEVATNSMPINEDIVPGPATAVMVAPSMHNEPHQCSPTVHINPVQMEITPLVEPDAAPAGKLQKPSRGRKRKVQEESSEPLNSDDIAVGLPKERYQPRPSRRRATEAVEEPIDYSKVPEKVAKSKRSKTAGSMSSAGAPTQLTDKDSLSITESMAKSIESADAVKPATTTDSRSTTSDSLSQVQAQEYKPSPVVKVPATSDAKPSQSIEATPQTVIGPASQDDKSTKQNDDFAFAKPALKIKLASKSKRSSTTIFEDHVDFTGKSRSPSLSQQQALRKTALKDVKNEATPAKRKRSGKAVFPDDEEDDDEQDVTVKAKRTRKVVLQDDDDDEDELASDPNARNKARDEPPDEPPKKRGRGRPPKTPSKPGVDESAKPAKQADRGEPDELATTTPEEPTKKRRGRPPKSAASAPIVDESKDQDDAKDEEVEPQDDKAPAKKSIEEPAEETAPSKTSASIPTPSPEKQPSAETKVAPEKKTKASPAAHSPIKSSSPAPYRVGLSKKHRIPSLLRVMRPPPAPVRRK